MMPNPACRRKKGMLPRAVVSVFVLILATAGCSMLPTHAQKDETDTVVWKHRDQFVRLESVSHGDEPAAKNDHPFNLEPGRFREILASLAVYYPRKEKTRPLFALDELNILAENLSNGLASATPAQDVAFAVVGIHREKFSVLQDRSVTSGRVFFLEGRLNLILGRVHAPYDEEEDRRTHPFDTGSRKKPSPSAWGAEKWEIASHEGLAFEKQEGVKRADWLLLDLAPEFWKRTSGVGQEVEESIDAALDQLSEIGDKSTKIGAEQEQLRQEMGAMKRELEQIRSAPPAPSPETAGASEAPVPGLKEIETRLIRLRSLLDKQLITPEEYQAKRKEILDDL